MSHANLIASLESNISAFITLLGDSRATKRKEAVKNLNSILDSSDFLHALDDQTLRLHPTAAVKSNKGLLARRAARLFQHIGDVLNLSDISSSSPVGRDYHAILKLLVADAEYCAAARLVDWDRLVELHLKWLRNAKSIASDDASRVLSMLGSLLDTYPGEPAADLLPDLIKVFSSLAELLEGNTLSRTGAPFFGAVNAFLSGSGVDVASQATALHAELHGPALRALKGREVRLKERAVQYMRMQLTLGGVTVNQMVNLRKWAGEEMEKNQWRASPQAALAAALTPAQHALLSLLAAVYAHSSSIMADHNEATLNAVSHVEEGEEEGADSRPPSAKRARAGPALPMLGDLAAQRPESVGPVAAMVLLQYTLAFPPEVHTEWLRRASAALPGAIAAWASTAQGDRLKSSPLLWLLRYLHALALASPFPAAALSFPVPAELWQHVWEALSAGFRDFRGAGTGAGAAAPPPEMEAGLWVMACIARRELCALPPTPHTLWGMPLMARDPTPGGVSLLAAALRAGADSAAHAGLWEHTAVQWAVRKPYPGLVEVGEAFLRLPKRSKAQHDKSEAPSLGLRNAQQGWAWWETDDLEERKIANMICGATYMRAKAKIADAESAEQRAEATRAGVPTAPVGIQMHKQLANLLGDMVAASVADPPGSYDAPPTIRGQWLENLFSRLSTSIDVVASVAAHVGNQDALPSCWMIDRPLGVQLNSALRAASAAVPAILCTVEGLTPEEQAGLAAVIAALHRHQIATGNVELGESLTLALPALDEAFSLEAAAVAAATAAAVATQAPTQFSIAATAAAFDDELDVGAAPSVRVRGTSKATQAGVQSASSLARVYKLRCADFLNQLAPLMPTQAAATVVKIIQRSQAPHRPQPSAVHVLLVQALLHAASAAVRLRFHEGPHLAGKALETLNETSGILSWKIEKQSSVPYGRLEFILDNIRVLVQALALPHGLATAPAAISAAARVAGQCFLISRRQELEEIGTSCALRIALARVAAVGLTVDTFFQGAGSGLSPDVAIEAVANLVTDDQYVARIAGGRLIQSVFLRLSDPSGLYREVHSKLLLASNAPEGNPVPELFETSIFMLGETAASCGSFELQCLLQLAREAALHPPASALIAATLDWLARDLGYTSRYDYAALYGPQLMHSWLVEGGSIDALVSVRSLISPTEGAAIDVANFAAACAPFLVGALVLMQDTAGLSRLAELVGSTSVSLLQRNLDSVVALVYPGMKSGYSSTRQLCRAVFDDGAMLRSLLGDNVLQQLGASAIPGIGRMLTEAQDPGDPTVLESTAEPVMPFFSPDTVVTAIRDIVGGDTEEEKEKKLWGMLLGEGQVASLLLEVATHLGRARHPRHLTTAKGALRAVLLLLDSKVARPATLRYVLSILLRLLRTPTLRPTCCILLGTTISHVFQAGAAAIHILGSMFPAVISALVEAVEESAAPHAQHAPTAPAEVPFHPEDFNQLIRLFDNLTVRAPPELNPYLPMVDPIPAAQGMEAAAHAVTQHRQHLTPVHQLSQFASRVASMPPALRRRSLKGLRVVMSENPSALYYEGSSTEESTAQVVQGGHTEAVPPSSGSRAKKEVTAAAWKLANLSADLGDHLLAEFAGELLAVAGPLPPESISFDSSALQQEGKRALGATVDTRQATQAIWTSALEMLSDYVIDEDTVVVRTAQTTLRHLLATPEGREAEKGLDASKRSLVAVFEGNKSPAKNTRTDAAPAEAADLWEISGRPYGTWVCELAYVMLKRADNLLLHSCARMARCKPALAELLLPLAFADLALHGTDDEADSTSHHVANAISKGLLSVCTKHPKAMRMLLRCLNHLRCMYLDGSRKNAASIAASSKTPSWTHRPLTNDEVVCWRKVYWLDLDYLKLAEAAVRCRAYFTALLYIEIWCEEANGGRLGLPSLETQPRRAEADALMLQIFSRIEEPDGLYAVARSNDILPQLRRFEKEGNWADALVSWDLALQMMGAGAGARTGVGGTIAGTNMNSSTDPGTNGGGKDEIRLGLSRIIGISRHEAESGILRCLSNLGASNLLGIASRAAAAAGGRGGGLGVASAGGGGGGTVLPGMSNDGFSSTAAVHAAALGQWAPLDPGAGEESRAADEGLSSAVAALSSGSSERCAQAVASARRALVAALATAGLESTGDVNPALVRLQMLHEVTEAWDLKWPNLPQLGSVGSPSKAGTAGHRISIDSMQVENVENMEEFQRIVGLWQGREKGAGARYALLAPLQDLRRELLSVLRAPAAEAHCLVQSAAAARKSRHFGQASGSLLRLRGLADSGAVPALSAADAPWRVEEAKVLWARGQTDAALSTIRGLLSSIHSERLSLHSAYVQALAAKWMAATKMESSATVRELLEVSSADVGNIHDPLASRIHYRLAEYITEVYNEIKDHIASPEWATAQAVILNKKADLEARQQRMKEKYANRGNSYGARFMAHQIRQLEMQLHADQDTANELIQRQPALLELALHAYARCMLSGDRYDLPALSRIVQMWLEHQESHGVNAKMEAIINAAPSHKFLPLVTQVASRLSAAPLASQSYFQRNLQTLLVRLGRDHPFHSLLQLFALKNGNRGADGKVVPAGGGGADMAYIADTEKVTAAADVLRAVASSSTRLKEIVSQLDTAMECYISLAATPVAKEATDMPFTANLRRQLIKLHAVPVLSLSLPVDHSLAYSDIPYLQSVSETIPLMNGINKPKLVQLTDSKGRSWKQLVKGGSDDMRQDAVMEQVFGLLNALLADAPATATRNLSIRTYKVVPFSPASGLLEWVENTKPLMDCIMFNGDPPGMNRGYSMVKNAQAAMTVPDAASLAKLEKTFLQATSQIPLTLHKFFLDKFREPGAWFEARLAYTRSTAANSIIGHIIGLGDRHCSNILVDQQTAEVVHIDLGIAFEQGKFLMTPERVPFRLTGNVVDGMGATGVEGPMRRCCEETLRVLRDQKEALLTVLEVLLHDPLYKWGLTLVQANRRQKKSDEGTGDEEGPPGDEGGGGNTLVGTADANRTLLRIKQKLEGVESGDSASRSVEGQVAHLLAEAMDPGNLCRMFAGWMAIL